MKPIPIHEAKTNLSRLIARVEAGEEIVLRRRDTPVAKLVAYEAAATKRAPGALKGKLRLADDFDATPADFGDYVG